MLEQHLEIYLAKITSAGATAVSWLSQGTQDFMCFDEVENVVLHPELQQLWSRFNGMTTPEDTLLGEIWLDGQFLYFSVEEALSDYQISQELREEDPGFVHYWPEAFVPIGTPGDGSRLLVDCSATSPTYGSVFDLVHGDGARRMAASLGRYFETLIVGFDEGALSVAPGGDIEVDFDAFRSVGKRMNPGCDSFG